MGIIDKIFKKNDSDKNLIEAAKEYKNKNFSKACELYSAHLQIDSKNLPALYGRALCRYHNGTCL